MCIVLPLPGNEIMAGALAHRLDAELGVLDWRRFPDGESYVRIASDVAGKQVDMVCTLARPDAQILSLVFAAETARELGAASVRLIAPYLAYMRQDARFEAGEAISSLHFARLLSRSFDSLITVDPHLHRRQRLEEIFSIPSAIVHAAPLLADWITQHVEHPLLIGPDHESAQWVAAVADLAGAPHAVAQKQRLSDHTVEVKLPELERWRGCQPVLIDDMISSGRTMMEAARGLAALGLKKPHCLAVHALFGEGAYASLLAVAEQVVSTDTARHRSNGLSAVDLIAAEMRAPAP